MSRHYPCPCNCGELSDECAGPNPNPLGSMTIRTTEPRICPTCRLPVWDGLHSNGQADCWTHEAPTGPETV